MELLITSSNMELVIQSVRFKASDMEQLCWRYFYGVSDGDYQYAATNTELLERSY